MSGTNERTVAAYDAHVQGYIDNTPHEISRTAREWLDTSLEGLSSDARILEIGSGFGHDAAYILRGYIFQFLRSKIGQSLMLKNAYGTNQEHLEPDVISEMPIPIPKNRDLIDEIGTKVISSIEELERSLQLASEAQDELDTLISYRHFRNES